MLAIISALFGFAAPFLPELVRFLQRRQDNAHELSMLELRIKATTQNHLWKMEELSAQADLAEVAILTKPQTSFGVQMLDAAAKCEWGKWATVPAFYLFTVLDFVAGMVRPIITYAVFCLYCVVKWAQYHMFFLLSTDMTVAEALIKIWREEDLAVLTLCLSYWFGHRAAKAAFGGSALQAERSR